MKKAKTVILTTKAPRHQEMHVKKWLKTDGTKCSLGVSMVFIALGREDGQRVVPWWFNLGVCP